MTIKYALRPGPVISKTDGDRHFIDAGTLMNLYRVPSHECIVIPWDVPRSRERERQLLLERVLAMGLIHLHPRYDGDYTLPEVTK